MISYTNKNVSILSFILAVLIFSIFHLNSLIPSILNKSKVFSRPIYYSQIPINDQNIKTSNSNLANSEKAVILEYENPINLQLNIKQKRLKDISISKTDNKNVINEKLINSAKNENILKNNVSSFNEEQKTKRQVINENKQNVWRLQIPKLNLDVHIKEGTSSNVLLSAIGHFENTSKWNGNVGLAAHNRGYKCNFFQDIKNLKIGDEIIYLSANGKKIYKVQINKVISETDWSYLNQTKNNCITLITCEENRGNCRRCIQAIEIADYKNIS